MSIIQLSSGNYFNYLDFANHAFQVREMAHSLANLCRYGGHCHPLYTVAQHSVIVSQIVPPEYAFGGLMHDTTEVYLGDMVRPLKELMPEYRAIEDSIWRAIAPQFDLPEELHECIHEADNIALVTEKRDLLPKHEDDKEVWAWAEGIKRLPKKIYPCSPTTAYHMFLQRYTELTGEKVL